MRFYRFFTWLPALFFILVSQISFAQAFTFNSIDPIEGTQYGVVSGITQDKAGYIWFGTSAFGLHRYDGHTLKTYTRNNLNDNSLIYDRTECVFADSDGLIWVGTFGSGMDHFNPATEKFTHFVHKANDANSLINDTVTAILRDHLGILWIGTHGGLNRYDSATKKFTSYTFNARDSTSLSNSQIRSIYEDRRGNLWIGTGSPFRNDNGALKDEGGLNLLNRATGKFIRFMHDPKNPNSLIDNRVRALFEDSKGNFWVGTCGDGLHTMDRDKGTFTRHLYNPAKPNQLSRPPVKNTLNYADDQVTSIIEDISGALWIATLEAGLTRYDPATGAISHFESDTSNTNTKTFREAGAWQLFTSRDGMLWISAWQQKLYRVDPLQIQVPHQTITGGGATCFATESPGVLLIGTPNGLLRKDIRNNSSRYFIHDAANASSISNNEVQSITKDSEGFFWIGTHDGLNRFDAAKNSFTVFKNDETNKNVLSSNYIVPVYEDPQKNLWAGTGRGLDRLDRQTNTFKHYRIYLSDTASYGKNLVTSILQSSKGDFWVGSWTAGGIHLMDREKGTFKNYLEGTTTIKVFEDTDGVVWVGATNGLYQYNPVTDSFYLFVDPGQPQGILSASNILEDDKKNLWVSIQSGILRINAKRDETSLYGSKFGVKGIDAINYISAYKGENNEFFMGDATGYYSFFPDQLTKQLIPPQINLTAFRLAGKQVKPDSEGPLPEPLEHIKEIRLAYNQNVFSIDFESIDYRDPDGNRNIYMLENYDQAWRQSGSDRQAFYFNVPPGEYVFKIKAANSGGAWAEKSIRIIITPPWWRTWWAYTLYALIAIAAAWLARRLIQTRIIKNEQIKNREKELAQAKEIEKAYHDLKLTQVQLVQAEKMASLGELTAGIAHEIQNPLNFVNNFSEVNAELIAELKTEQAKEKNERSDQLENELLSDIEQNLAKINHHGKRADAIVKNMLQHSRTSGGQKEPTDINALCDEYFRLSYHGLRAKDKNFNATLKTDFDETIGNINVIPQDIGRVLLNLYNNAFYAAPLPPEGGFRQADGIHIPTVWVSTKKMDDKVLISVRDNGAGIPDNIVDKIFQPFFTTKPTGQGTGLGLSLSYDIVKAHGGDLTVETEEARPDDPVGRGTGTTFIIRLPYTI